jgi:hypothetical protein
VIGLIVLLVLILTLLALLGLLVWEAACQQWEQRAERARIDAEVRQAERRLHGMARNAFGTMLDVARQHRAPGDSAGQ